MGFGAGVFSASAAPVAAPSGLSFASAAAGDATRPDGGAAAAAEELAASDHAAILYRLLDGAGDAVRLTILVWNAQDWKDSRDRSPANARRGRALTGMLIQYRPDLVVLLETGEAGKPNKFIADYVSEASSVTKIVYDAPVALGLEDTKTKNDKSVVYFGRADLAIPAPSVYPIDGKGERRPVLIFRWGGMDFAFLHAIAQRGAAAKQIYELLLGLTHPDSKLNLCFMAGDLNHEPDDARGRRVLVRTGSPTHYSSTRDSFAELDWGFVPPRCRVALRCTATRITETVYAGRRCVVWRGALIVPQRVRIAVTRSASGTPTYRVIDDGGPGGDGDGGAAAAAAAAAAPHRAAPAPAPRFAFPLALRPAPAPAADGALAYVPSDPPRDDEPDFPDGYGPIRSRHSQRRWR